MQGIYNYVPEANHVSRVYNVAVVLYLQFLLHVMLFHPWNWFIIIIIIIIIIITTKLMIVYGLDVRDFVPRGRWFFSLPSHPLPSGFCWWTNTSSKVFGKRSPADVRVFVLMVCPILGVLCNSLLPIVPWPVGSRIAVWLTVLFPACRAATGCRAAGLGFRGTKRVHGTRETSA